MDLDRAKNQKNFKQTTVILGLTGIIFGILLIVFGVLIGDKSTSISIILTNLGASTLIAAVIGVIFESIQKEILTEELSATFKINSELRSSGIEAIHHPSHEKMNKLIRSDEVKIVPLDPIEWHSSYWPGLIRDACKRPTKIHIWIPDTDSGEVGGVIARRKNKTTLEIQREYSTVIYEIEKTWDEAEVHEDSRLLLKTYPDIPTIGVYSNGVKILLEYRYAETGSPSTFQSSWIELDNDGRLTEWPIGEIYRLTNDPECNTRITKPSAYLKELEDKQH